MLSQRSRAFSGGAISSLSALPREVPAASLSAPNVEHPRQLQQQTLTSLQSGEPPLPRVKVTGNMSNDPLVALLYPQDMQTVFFTWFKYKLYAVPPERLSSSNDRSQLKKLGRMIAYMKSSYDVLPTDFTCMPEEEGDKKRKWFDQLSTLSVEAQTRTVSFLATALKKSPTDTCLSKGRFSANLTKLDNLPDSAFDGCLDTPLPGPDDGCQTRTTLAAYRATFVAKKQRNGN